MRSQISPTYASDRTHKQQTKMVSHFNCIQLEPKWQQIKSVTDLNQAYYMKQPTNRSHLQLINNSFEDQT
jgi:hypothetical protein